MARARARSRSGFSDRSKCGEVGRAQLGGARPRALLALLCTRLGTVVPSELIVDDLWGEAPPATARHMVAVYVSKLRKCLGEDVLVTQSPGYVLLLNPEQLDTARFERLLAEGREALAVGDSTLPLLASAKRSHSGGAPRLRISPTSPSPRQRSLALRSSVLSPRRRGPRPSLFWDEASSSSPSSRPSSLRLLSANVVRPCSCAPSMARGVRRRLSRLINRRG